MDISGLTALITRLLPYLYALIGFCLLIVVHELGHFFFCKLFNVYTPSFSIGFGPVLVQKKIGTTMFKLSALPFGGYVEIAGNAEVGQGEQGFSSYEGSGSFKSKKYWKKLLIMLGGILFNLILAYILMATLLLIGSPKPAIFINSVTANSPGAKANLAAGDKLLSWNNANLTENPTLLGEEIKKLQNRETCSVTLCIERDKQQITKTISIDEAGESNSAPSIGIGFEPRPSTTIEKYSLLDAVKLSIVRTNSFIAATAASIIRIFTQGSLKGAGGPIMILAESSKQARQSFAWLLQFLAIISINLAIINLLPLPIFDGGQIAFLSVEEIIGKEMPFKIKYAIHAASWLMILLLLFIFSYNDIKSLIATRL